MVIIILIIITHYHQEKDIAKKQKSLLWLMLLLKRLHVLFNHSFSSTTTLSSSIPSHYTFTIALCWIVAGLCLVCLNLLRFPPFFTVWFQLVSEKVHTCTQTNSLAAEKYTFFSSRQKWVEAMPILLVLNEAVLINGLTFIYFAFRK